MAKYVDINRKVCRHTLASKPTYFFGGVGSHAISGRGTAGFFAIRCVKLPIWICTFAVIRLSL